MRRSRPKAVQVRQHRNAFTFEGSGEYNPPVIDYSQMDRDALVDHFIDEGGLARFIDTQQTGVDRADWNWTRITLDLMAFSPYLQFSPSYLEEIYEMQKARAAHA